MAKNGRRKNAAPGQQGRGVIVLAGEDSNDCKIMAEIIKQHHPELGGARLVPLIGIVVHEDLDGYTDAEYVRIRAGVAAALSRESPCDSALALAAWESEAWLLLFPDAFPAVRPNWKVPAQLRGRDTGALTSPKEELKRRLGAPSFRESDGPKVAEKARSLGLLASGPTGRNRSYEDFVQEISAWDGASGK